MPLDQIVLGVFLGLVMAIGIVLIFIYLWELISYFIKK